MTFLPKLARLLGTSFVVVQFLGDSSCRPDKNETYPDTLVLGHVIFRHGNRTGQKSELYPKDPYLNFDYFPFGNGQLTNEGKRKEFAIGKALRDRYERFLGPYFYPDIVEAVSTDYNRTKASLELVLASLFFPRGVEIWKPNYNWQPVPYNYLPINKDKVLHGISCPNYTKLYDRAVSSPKLKAEFTRHKEHFDYISKHTGLNVTSYRPIYNVYFGLSTEEEWGFQLPPWTKKVWPKIITDLAIKEYFVQTSTTPLNQMASGYHMKKILKDTADKIRNINENHGRKLYLYSCHENNIAEMLIYLNIFDPPHIPPYGSYLIFEVHNINGTYGIKIYYQRYVTREVQLLKLPSCTQFCPLDKFTSIVEEYIPPDNLCGI